MKVGIIGCGYLGKRTALLLRKKGDHIIATTRTSEKCEELSEIAHKTILFRGQDEDELAPLIAECDVLIVTIAANGIDQYESAYLQNAQLLRRLALEMNLPRQLLYTSSTSVYGDFQGQWVDEDSALLASSDQAKILVQTEKIYLSLEEIGWRVVLLRLAEIYGPGRELSQKIAKKATFAGDGSQYTNMVHVEDCAAAIEYALRHNLEQIYNVADDVHPTRKELYEELAKKHHLPFPVWDPSQTPMHTGNKKVSNRKIKKDRFKFRYPERVLD